MTEESKSIPEEFTKVIKDFVNDLRFTFPEYETFISKWWKDKAHYNYIDNEDDRNQTYEKSVAKSTKLLFNFCQKKFPPRFFDILYQNEDMFKQDSDIDTEFFPNIHFKNLWQCDISKNTRDTIWRYLQLIMFAIIGTIENKAAFGDTAKIFEAINADEFKGKLEETLSHMQNLFDTSGNLGQGMGSGINMENMPDADQIHDHITGMLDGKLGQLAREIAEEAASNLNVDFEDATDMKDVFQKLMQNPTKLMGLVKTVGDKLDGKMKSGELKESELIAEATEIMNKMKNMPGMDNIQAMLSKMGMGGMAGMGGKINMGAMEAQLNSRLKMAKTKERIRAKSQATAKSRMEQEIKQAQQAQQTPKYSEEELLKLFDSAEKIERTPRGTNPANDGKKKKKGKK